MSIRLQIFLSICALLFLFYTIHSIRNRGLDLYHSIIWLAGAVLLLLIAVFPGPIMGLAAGIGVTTPSNYVFFLVIAFLLLASISLSAGLSRQHNRIKRMVQSIAILENRLEESERQIRELSTLTFPEAAHRRSGNAQTACSASASLNKAAGGTENTAAGNQTGEATCRK